MGLARFEWGLKGQKRNSSTVTWFGVGRQTRRAWKKRLDVLLALLKRPELP